MFRYPYKLVLNEKNDNFDILHQELSNLGPISSFEHNSKYGQIRQFDKYEKDENVINKICDLAYIDLSQVPDDDKKKIQSSFNIGDSDKLKLSKNFFWDTNSLIYVMNIPPLPEIVDNKFLLVSYEIILSLGYISNDLENEKDHPKIDVPEIYSCKGKKFDLIDFLDDNQRCCTTDIQQCYISSSFIEKNRYSKSMIKNKYIRIDDIVEIIECREGTKCTLYNNIWCELCHEQYHICAYNIKHFLKKKIGYRQIDKNSILHIEKKIVNDDLPKSVIEKYLTDVPPMIKKLTTSNDILHNKIEKNNRLLEYFQKLQNFQKSQNL